MTFRVRQEVVCIEDDTWVSLRSGSDSTGPRKGDVCVITAIIPYRGRTFLRFAEWSADGFDASSFRPLVRTDISILTAMLAPAPKQKEVERVE